MADVFTVLAADVGISRSTMSKAQLIGPPRS